MPFTLRDFNALPAGFSETIIRAAVGTEPDDLVVQARALDERPVRVWELRFPEATGPEMRDLRVLHRQTAGGCFPLSFTPPGEVSSVPVLLEGDLVETQFSASHYSVTVRAREVVH